MTLNHQTSSSGSHRPDIDGLRAVAVLAVILFHVNPHWVPGGFVGVDIFFVISGYLITSIVARELEAGSFTFRRFYERRLRRILPALWALMIVCVPVSWLLLLPADAQAMGKSAIWSVLALANVYFWREVSTDYFAPQSSELPFLHLWSLGVEEQFYLVWPVVLMLVWRFRGARARGLAAALALALVFASTVFAEYLLAKEQARFAYYMLPARAGELALGAALALMQIPQKWQRERIAGIAAGTGWGLIVLSLCLLDEQSPFPGWRSLLPTTGAAALILAGQLNVESRWLWPLRSAPARWLGLCSYSAYLWHWPLLAWWRYLAGQPGTLQGIGLVLLIVLMARASQWLVEDPARSSGLVGMRLATLYGIAPAILIGVFALLVARSEQWGVQLHSSTKLRELAALQTYTSPAHHEAWICQQHQLTPDSLRDPQCEFGASDKPATVMLLGDSHAAQFAPVIRAAAEAQSVRVRTVALGSCAPLNGLLKGVVADARLAACEQGMAKVFARAREFPLLIIGADWATYARNDPRFWVRFKAELLQLSQQGHRVWLLPKVPRFARYDAACQVKQAWVGDWLTCPRRLEPMDSGQDTNARLEALARSVPGTRFLAIHASLCDSGSCALTDEKGRYIYADPTHLSVHGARQLAKMLQQAGQLPDLVAEPGESPQMTGR